METASTLQPAGNCGGESGPFGLAPREELLLETLRSELRAGAGKLEAEQARLQQVIATTLNEMRLFASRLEVSLLGRLDELSSEQARLREAIDCKFSGSDERAVRIEKTVAQLCGLSDELKKGMERLAEAFDRQLTSSERTLEAMRELGEKRLADLRESHRRHLASVERARDAVLRLEKRSRERLSSRLEETADFLEGRLWPAVPAPAVVNTPEPAAPASAGGPLRMLLRRLLALPLGLLARRRARTQALSALEQRTSQLEDLLRERWEENVRRGRELRMALREEFASQKQLELDTLPEALAETQEVAARNCEPPPGGQGSGHVHGSGNGSYRETQRRGRREPEPAGGFQRLGGRV
jgi:hypothetical protein